MSASREARERVSSARAAGARVSSVRWLASAACVCVLLGAWLVFATPRADTAPTEQLALERLLPEGALAGRKVAAIEISAPGRALTILHVRSKGRWRVREAYGAPSDTAAVEAFLEDVTEARGLALAADPSRADAFGFTDAGLVRVTLHGPKVLDAPGGDPLASIEFGELVHGRACARRVEVGAEHGAWLDLDRDVCGRLGALDADVPPLADAHFLAASLPEGAGGLVRMRVERRDAPALEIAHAAPPGGGEPVWTLTRDGSAVPCPPWRAGGYMGFLLRGTGNLFAPAARVSELGFTPPFARVVLTASGGGEIELSVSELQAGGLAWVWNHTTNVVLRTDAAGQRLVAPLAEDFLDTQRVNPWESWLANRGTIERPSEKAR